MNSWALILIIVFYLACLFGIAFFAERRGKNSWANSPYVYVLSLAVYCSAWTYYGSVGIASKSSASFLGIYLGPVISMPLWIFLMRKVIRISKQHKISSIADFISMRYGNNRALGALVTLVCLVAVIPYISLQLKATSETFGILLGSNNRASIGVIKDSTFYIALLIAVFVAFFGTLSPDTSKRKKGITTTVAIESVLKLTFFLVIGVYVVFYLFDGTQEIYHQAAQKMEFNNPSAFGGMENGFNWLFNICLSFFAIFLLPRQFQVSVVENHNERHLKKAIWLFPLYLLLFNVFVIFIAWAGNIRLPQASNPDYYTLLLPLQAGNLWLSVLVFIGGFSAAISMIVVSTLALSTMVSNNLIIPYGFLNKLVKGNPRDNAKSVKNLRRGIIFLLIIGAYFFYINFSTQLSLFSIGLISFVLIAQLAPSFFLGLFWRRGKAKAAQYGMGMGVLIVIYVLTSPVSDSRLAFAGMDYLSLESHAFLWSISGNALIFVVFSLSVKGNYRERNYAEMFVGNENYENLEESAFIWKGEAYVADIRSLLYRFLGEARTDRALNLFNRKYGIPEKEEKADARLINFSEKLLTGTIGSTSAKTLLSSVSKEKPISLVEVLEILEETKETKASNKLLLEKSKELSETTQQLQLANEELLLQDRLKDEFLDTVAHELKTPITSIKAASEVLEDEEMPKALRAQFLHNIEQDADRLSTLIHNILDLEKLSGNRAQLNLKTQSINASVQKAIKGIEQIASKTGVDVQFHPDRSLELVYDEDRILQVLTNLFSNALKFIDKPEGMLRITLKDSEKEVTITVEDNGKGIPKDEHQYIFEKFYQSKDQNTKKPQGSGFGLAICRSIVESHKGRIWSDPDFEQGARFMFTIPKQI